jgi:hypothetical protein
MVVARQSAKCSIQDQRLCGRIDLQDTINVGIRGISPSDGLREVCSPGSSATSL